MSAVRLRILTEKSLLNYGNRYPNCLVGDLLKFEEVTCDEMDYLVWSYYYLSNISFTDSILDKLTIKTKIDKPGKNPELYIEWKKELVYGMDNLKRLNYYAHKSRRSKAIRNSVNQRMNTGFNARVQRFHHGHRTKI